MRRQDFVCLERLREVGVSGVSGVRRLVECVCTQNIMQILFEDQMF